MWPFARPRTNPIRVTLDVRAFVGGRMVSLHLDAQAERGGRLSDVLRRLGREGSVDASVVRQVLRGSPGVTVLRNGQRLALPEAGKEPLADGDELSILTPFAGG